MRRVIFREAFTGSVCFLSVLWQRSTLVCLCFSHNQALLALSMIAIDASLCRFGINNNRLNLRLPSRCSS